MTNPYDDGTTYTVLTTGAQTPHNCGYNLSDKFGPEWPSGTVVKCDICGRRWRKGLTFSDGISQWKWESRWQRRKRVGSVPHG